MAFGCSPKHEVLVWLAISDFHHIMQSTNANAVDNGLQLILFNFPHRTQHASSSPSSWQPGEDDNQGRCSSL
jgi:hypothetical protein